MVAISATRRSHNGLVIPGPPRQSSLRSVSSTHSRRSLYKTEDSVPKRRVRFSENPYQQRPTERVHVVERFEDDSLYYRPEDIQENRTQIRKVCTRFATDYPDYVREIEGVFDNGLVDKDMLDLVQTLRQRRKQLNPFKISMKWLEIDDEEDPSISYDEEEEDTDDVDVYRHDDDEDVDVYCTMRGLESRVVSKLRSDRRFAITKVLLLQDEMREAGCERLQIEMGLRAVATQVSQKARFFAVHQALLDAQERYY